MITPEQAQVMMSEIKQTQDRSREFTGYWRAGVYIQLWGFIWFIFYLGNYLRPELSGWIWLVGDSCGVLGSILIGKLQSSSKREGEGKFYLALSVVVIFGVLVSNLIKAPEAIGLFWNCLFMTIYMLVGVWEGKRWFLLGASVFVLSVLSYWALFPWFNLAMAILGGGGLMLGGTLMRRAA